MLLTKITFIPKELNETARAKLVDEMLSLFASFKKNGQIWGKEVWGWVDDELCVYCSLPRPDSFAAKYHSEWVRNDLGRVEILCRRPFRWEVIDDRAEAKEESWSKSNGLYLFTHTFDETSPVCCGTNGAPVPLYLLPIDQRGRQGLHHWMHRYQELDAMQLDCGTLEVPAYTEMADPNSQLSKEGRELAKTIEEATGIRTFYYLMRYWGRANGEDKRACPGCGGQWSCKRKTGERGLGWFDFRCERCRLVSHLADTFDDEQKAQIGEWKG